ncbi:MAG: hypothetical protein HP496_01390 [Nitrospira sp.]|nr:hypothetical protein [Nitrospira sp.]
MSTRLGSAGGYDGKYWVGYGGQGEPSFTEESLTLVLLGEMAIGMGLRGITPAMVILNRDLVSGTAHYVSPILFAAMPWIVSRR